MFLLSLPLFASIAIAIIGSSLFSVVLYHLVHLCWGREISPETKKTADVVARQTGVIHAVVIGMMFTSVRVEYNQMIVAIESEASALTRLYNAIERHGGEELGDTKKRIIEYIRLGVELIYIGKKVGSSRCFNVISDKDYTIDDVYHSANLVTYPSGYEGFGNAFVEAIYFKKPIVVNRYSIFVEDIEPCGFDVIPFEGFVTKEIGDYIMQFLKPENVRSAVEKNYELGKKYFSYEVLEQKLLPLLESFRQQNLSNHKGE